MELLKNRQIVTLRQGSAAYHIDIAIAKSFIADWETFFFSLLTRQTGEAQTLAHRVIGETDDYYVFQVDVFYREYIKEIVDLSIVRRRGYDEEQRSRIRSNYDKLAFLQTEIDETSVFYPDTTRQGNVSFYYEPKAAIATFEAVNLSDDAQLELKGFYHYPGLAFMQIQQLTLLVTSSVDEEIVHRVPVEPFMIPALYGDQAWYDEVKKQGFGAALDLEPFFVLGRTQFLKFYLEIAVEGADGERAVYESKRIKVNHLEQANTNKERYTYRGSKLQVSARPTAKAKYFSLRIAEYKAIPELMRNVKRKWVEIRRSKQLLQIYKGVFYVLGVLLPVKKNRVIFESFHGKQVSDNPRAIYEQMLRDGLDYELVWSADRRHVATFAEAGVPYVRRFSVRWLLYMTRAQYWVTNARLPLWIPKPRGTIYVQTWHGTPLKRLALDMEEVHMPGTNTEQYKENFTTEVKKWDYLISPNAYSTAIFKRAFQFEQTMIETGYPRNDFLYEANDPATIVRLKETIGIDPAKKVILYAPTWRDNQFYGRGRYKFDLAFDLEQLHAAFGETHVIMLRMHYLVAENLDIAAYEGFVYDLSTHPDIGELYLIADLLITDYSSVFFDYANLQRPIIFFVYDIDEYRDNLRGFYFDLEKNAPGPLTRTTEELIAEIAALEQGGFVPSAAYEAFYDRFCYLEDGHASERVIEHVFKA